VPANELYVGPAIDARIGRRLALRLGGALQTLDDERGALLRESVIDARATFHFSSRARVRATLVQRHTVRDPLTNPPGIAGDTRSLSYQLVYGWELNARTLIYAGFDEQRDDERAPGLTPLRRTFFLKLGHAIQP
jgi:hypothetical protein